MNVGVGIVRRAYVRPTYIIGRAAGFTLGQYFGQCIILTRDIVLNDH